jgi:hypothetical protein
MAPIPSLRVSAHGREGSLLGTTLLDVMLVGIVAACFCFFFKKKKAAGNREHSAEAPNAASKPQEPPVPHDAASPAVRSTTQTGANGASVESTSKQASSDVHTAGAAVGDRTVPLKNQVAVVCLTLDDDFERVCKDDRYVSFTCIYISLALPTACILTRRWPQRPSSLLNLPATGGIGGAGGAFCMRRSGCNTARQCHR